MKTKSDSRKKLDLLNLI